jgi:hypothetical protein
MVDRTSSVSRTIRVVVAGVVVLAGVVLVMTEAVQSAETSTLATKIDRIATGDGEGAGPGQRADRNGTNRLSDAVDTKAKVGKVTGKLGKKQTRRVVRRVSRIVNSWTNKAYLKGDYPRKWTTFRKSFPHFTAGARKLARGRRGVMSNADIGRDITRVMGDRRRVRVDILAVKGKARAVTAHVVVVFKTKGEFRRTVRVRGDVVLIPSKPNAPKKTKWRVFGFDMAKGAK